MGDFFHYLIKQPVSLPRQKSALLPIINEEIRGEKVSIYNESVQAKFPLLGLKFTNNTALHLNQGPITVFENDVYAGDARIQDVKQNEERLISYAIDLGTEVKPETSQKEELTKVKIVKGILFADFVRRDTKTYKIKNRSETAKTLLVEHPVRDGFKLTEPAKPAEETRNLYRFAVKCEPQKEATLNVVEEFPRRQEVSIANSDSEAVRFFIRASEVSAEAKAALTKALQMRQQESELQREKARMENELALVEREQRRIRENMAVLPRDTDVFKRYLGEFEEQDAKMKSLRQKLVAQQEKIDTHRRDFETFVANIDVK